MEKRGKEAVAADRLIFPRILVATDFSANAHRALRYALSLARRYGSKVYLVHVLPEHALESPHRESVHDRSSAEQRMNGLTRMIPGCADSCTVLIEEGEGPIWIPIERVINAHKIDLIIAGTRGLGGRGELFLGSGAEQIFRHATCPVLTIGPASETDDLSEMDFKNVLYVTDFGPSAERALGYAVSIARKFEASLRFLHVVEHASATGERAFEHLRQIQIQRMKRSLQASHAATIAADFCVRFGNVADEILCASHEARTDLVVMGAKATGVWAGHVPLSTAYNVAAKASCPVLTVRA